MNITITAISWFAAMIAVYGFGTDEQQQGTNNTAVDSKQITNTQYTNIKPMQTDDYYWLIGKWQVLTQASDGLIVGDLKMSGLRVYKPYLFEEDLDIYNVTNRCISAEFIGTDSQGKEHPITDLYGVIVTTNEFLIGWPPPPISFKYQHYRSGTNEILNIYGKNNYCSLIKTNNYPGRPIVSFMFPELTPEEKERLDRLYQQLRKQIRENKP